MKSRRRWLWRWQHRRLALALALYTLLLLLLVSYVLDLGAGRGRQGQEEPCPSLEGASGGSSWRQQQQEALQHQEKDEQGKPREPHHHQQHQYEPHEPQQYHGQQQHHEQQQQHEPREPHQPQEQPPATPLDATSPHEGPSEERKDPQGAVGGQKKRHIYLHATWRTGSSFVGELFNQHPDVFYLYEPMWHLWQALYPGDAASLQGALRDMLRSLFRCDFSVLRLYGSAASSSFDALSLFPVGGARGAPTNLSTSSLFGWRNNKVICSAPLCPSAPRPRGEVGLVDGASCERSCPPKPLRELEEECRKYPVVVIKDVRLLELGVLLPLLRDPGLDVRVVQLFRDPRAVHNSRLKTKQALLRESIQVLRSRHRTEPRALLRRLLPQIAAPRGQQSGGRAHNQRADFFLGGALEVICQGWHRDLLFSRDAPSWIRSRYTQLRYEDLVQDPRRELRRLLSFADLPAPSDLEDFVVNMTRGDAYSSDRPFHISARDAREAVHAWRERLSQQQVSQVEAACGEAMALLAYPLSSHVQGDPGPPPHPG